MAYTRQLRTLSPSSALIDTGVAAAGSTVGIPPQASIFVANLAQSIFGGHTGPLQVGQGNKIDQARAARADSYLVGALIGNSVDSARYALGAKQTNTAAAEQALYARVLSYIQQNAPDLYQQASAAGAMHDTASGLYGLQILLSLGIPFNDPWAGYSTAHGEDLGDGAPQVAAQLTQLAGGGFGQAQGQTLLQHTTTPTPAPTGTAALPTTGASRMLTSGFTSPLAIVAIAGAVIYAATQSRRSR